MHRTATFYDIKITASGKSRAQGNEADFVTDPKPLSEMYGFIDRLFKGGDRILKKGRSEKSAKYYISDMDVRDGRLILLINRSDPNAPDAVSTDPENKNRVVHEKPPGHGGDSSAHVVINLVPSKGDNYYVCVIETVYGSGLHASSVSDYLRFVFRHCRLQFPKEFLIPNCNGARDADGNPLLVRHYHSIELQGHPSSEFEKDLETGTLSGIELLDFSERGAVWDDKGGVYENSRAVILKPEHKLMTKLSVAVKQVRNKVIKNGENYPQMRLRFKNEKGEPRDATIETDSGNLIDEHKYVKRHIISAPLVNTASLEFINNGIVKEVFALME
ncbi:TPA: hypothetical protein ACKP15_001417 [Pseudomonas aeruginosa]|uniref:hypothetical protein n=1 Tax=Pseudomonas aeruginosa TaxID=287 RepID=UPI0003B991E5|nr:hypothetical protein [Pseudomonas aeruginosa]EKV8083224.1 hypothetical protein [Pseudomonas aeruginosa]ELP1277185.1 hypothetical protein [Pseudomonas aeruginosa]ELP1322300.1 hypothetical protein [Pseudomonas aeruginosa]ERX86349.1 hypothetical protein Q083_02051 [Pseudomonas aeruginosa M8A.4]MBG3950489.1 hypothetical protein [Pseudomonas aeruginosa]